MLNLYDLAQDPSKINGHDVAYDSVPELAWEKYETNRAELKKREYLWARSPKFAYYYARDAINRRWVEAEPVIMKDPVWAYNYAIDLIGCIWPEAEPVIAEDPQFAYCYAVNVIHGRWPKAEPVIMKDPESAFWYSRRIMYERWPEAECYIKQDPYWWGMYKECFKC